MEFKFEKFTGRNIKSEERITITKSNSIGFPQKFYTDNGIGKYKYVVFYWDKDNMSIGINFCNNDEEKNKFKIMHIGYGGSVIARSFFRVNNIDPAVYHGKYEWEKKNIEGIGELYIITLNNSK